MTDKVRRLDTPWYGLLDPDAVLGAAQGKLRSVVIIGIEHDGGAYYASSDRDAKDILWATARMQHKLLKGDFT